AAWPKPFDRRRRALAGAPQDQVPPAVLLTVMRRRADRWPAGDQRCGDRFGIGFDGHRLHVSRMPRRQQTLTSPRCGPLLGGESVEVFEITSIALVHTTPLKRASFSRQFLQ